MRLVATLTFVVVVAALLVQSLSLALHPQTSASAAADLNPHAHYGTAEPGAEPGGSITAGGTLRIFLTHGIAVAFATLVPRRGAGVAAGKPMRRAVWRASRYYRAGLHFHRWSRTRADREARRYDAVLGRRFDAAWHPLAALCGYWLGRLVFFWAAIALVGALGALVGLGRVRALHAEGRRT